MATRTAEHNAKIGASLRALGRGESPTKWCPKCQKELPRSDFDVRPNGFTRSYCTPCRRADDREKSRRHWNNNPEYRERSRRGNRAIALRRYHGITVADYQRMFDAQKGVCAICGSTSTRRGRQNLDIDHCHATNVIRGLLCSRCNLAIGYFDDAPDRLRRAADYLETNRWPDIVRNPRERK